MGPLVPRTWTLTTRLRSGRVARLKRTGSLTASLPAATRTELRLENVSLRLVPATVVAPVSWRAILTRPNVTARVPKTFVSRSRQTRPPMLGRTTIRSVWSRATFCGNACVSSGPVAPGPSGPGNPGWPTR
jgi:hypothetical protein